MQYPLISEYVDAIRSAEDNFDKLCNLRPVLDGNGNPVMSSGNFAVGFKMKNVKTGKLYAVKCFTKEQEGREEAYRKIADELEFVQPTYLAKVTYYDRELFVDTNSSDDSEFPVLLMDWVEGETLDKYIRQNINDTYALAMLVYNFSHLTMWLLPQPFAHGDLKPDNILVQDDCSLTLVDYDGMFVPAMQGQKSRELGSPDFRHPLRTESNFNEHIDDFPAISILLSLRLIATDPSLLDRYGASDRLLLSESDYRDLSSCDLLKSVFPSQDAEINTLVGLFAIALSHKTLSNVSFRLLAVAKPAKLETVEILSTEVTDEDLANAVEDEFGAKYSKDGKRLLRGVDVGEYKIRVRTKIICDWAFCGCNLLQSVTIPSSVTSIGNYVFSGCGSLQEITIPESITAIGANPFTDNKCRIVCKSPYFKVVDNSLYDSEMKTIISCLSSQSNFSIPFGVTSIGYFAFDSCSSLQSVTIPSSVTSIGDNAFSGCSSLQSVKIPSNVTSIGDNAFSGCSSLQSISIPFGVTSIGNEAFECCFSLCEIIIPETVKTIKSNPFTGCHCKITNNSPYFKVLDNVLYNNDLTKLISFLSEERKFTIPSSVVSIENSAFDYCSSLQEIIIPSSVTSIGYFAFYRCLLQKITIPASVTDIGINPFDSEFPPQEILIPKGYRSKFEQLLPDYKDLLIEVDNI